MKAVMFERYGPPEVLQLRDIPKPVPKPNEVLVRIHAATVGAEDPMIRGFTFSPLFWLPLRLSFGIFRPRKKVLGSEFSGEVVTIGEDVRQFAIGDRVFGADIKGLGSNAEYRVMPEDGLMLPIPSGMTYEEVAPACSPLAAWNLLKDQAHIKSGQTVLINGASGGIGTIAVQIARHFTSDVTGVCSTANLELVKTLGASHVIDYTQEDFTKNGKTYDVILDAVSKRSFMQCKHSLTKTGIYISAVPSLSHLFWVFWTSRFGGKKALFSATGLRPVQERLVLFKEVAALMGQGAIKPVIDRRYPLERIPEAHSYVARGHKKGNVVITVGPDGQ